MAFFEVYYPAVRANAGMTQQEWADALGTSQPVVSSWEQGLSEPKASQIRMMSELSGIPMEYIFMPKKPNNLDSKEV